MAIIESAKKRYATKAFDTTKTLNAAQINTLKSVLRLSPSSLNLQPWHFIVATTQAAKDKIATSMQGKLKYNQIKTQAASMVVVLCARTEIDEAYIQRIVEQENRDGRMPDEATKSARFELIKGYIERHANVYKDTEHWLEKQAYIALGNVLLAASDMGIDSVPIEGFDATALNHAFALPAKGLRAVVIAAFGYRSTDDFNARLPKSRLPDTKLFTDC